MIDLRCEEVKNKIKEIEKEIAQIEKEMKQLPKGSMICSRDASRYKWFLKEDGKYKYLPKENRTLAEKLAVKRYYENKLTELRKELDAFEYYLKNMEKTEGKAEAMIYHQEWGKLIAPYFKAPKMESQKWMEEEYDHCPKYEENLIFKGTQGKMLRSKSEVIIDMMLYKYKIPFRYEAKLELNSGIDLYPDFTICHPVTGDIIYWEHFGKMDDVSYRNNACNKIRLYCENDIIPFVNLIATYETKEHPLSIVHVENIIKEYFLT